MEISLCMIVKNEEKTLARCLESVKSCVDEIVIVDTGSTDETISIAENFGAMVSTFSWKDDFAAARNYAFSLATKPYLFWLDADDYLTPENTAALLAWKQAASDKVDIVNLPYSLARDENGTTITSLRRNRIVKKSLQAVWVGRVHEYLSVTGNTTYLDVEVWHDKHKSYTDRNLRIFRDMMEKGEPFSTRDRYYFANELYYNEYYQQAIEQYQHFLKLDGWIEDQMQASVNLSDCFLHLKERDHAISSLLDTFTKEKPRAIVCCRLGDIFFDEARYSDACFWYESALSCLPDSDTLGLVMIDYATWIPAIQLCVCHEKMGDYKTAYYYNELCGVLQGPIEKVSYNRAYLTQLCHQNNLTLPPFRLHIKPLYQ